MKRMFLALAPLLLLGSAIPAGRAADAKPADRIKAVDAYVVSDRVFVPGTQASVRVVARAVVSLTESRPLPQAEVALTLSDGKDRAVQLFAGRADEHGTAEAVLRIPRWPDGDYQMQVVVRSPYGERRTNAPVKLESSGRILLVTDKPVYQPGQTIRMRALALDAFDLHPLAGETLRLEVLDPKGNKVFKEEIETSAYGIAAATFELAAEIDPGEYQIEAASVRSRAAESAAKTVVVKKYVLPKFKVALQTGRAYYLPQQVVHGSVQADYFFGKPVAGGQVQVKASTFDVRFREFATVKGRTDAGGKFAFEIKLPDHFVGQPLEKGDALVRLEVELTDTAAHVERAVQTVPVAAQPIRLTAVPEGGRLVAGVPNLIYAVATYPDGSPARAAVTIALKDRRLGRAQTDQSGLVRFEITPRTEDMRPGPYRPRGSFGRDRRRFHVRDPDRVRTQVLDLVFTAEDQRGRRCEIEQAFSTEPEGDRILLRTDRAIYPGGDSLEATVLTTSASGFCYLDLIKNRQTLLSRIVPIEKGRAHLRIPFGPTAFGTLELHAYQIQDDGQIVRDARIVYVQPPGDLRVSVARDEPVYRPGGEALIRFQVTDRSGAPRPAALGLIVVDEAVYALQELKPGLEKVYFTLERELAKPRAQIEYGPADSLADLIKASGIRARRQNLAKVLLAKAQPVGEPGLWQNPQTERLQAAQKDRWAMQNALRQYGRQHPLGQRLASGKWAYAPDLVASMIAAGVLPKGNQTDPLGASYTMDTVAALWPELRAERFLAGLELNRLWALRGQIYHWLYQQTHGLTDLGGRGLAQRLPAAYRRTVKQQPELVRDLDGKIYSWSYLRDKPGFRVRDMAAAVHAGRVLKIYLALARYGQESQRWYRVSVLDEKADAYRLPEDVLSRIVLRRILSPQNANDIWGRPFRLRKRSEARTQVIADRRLRYYEVYSLGPDGQENTEDDLVYDTIQSDEGYRALAEVLGVDPNAGLMIFGALDAIDGAPMAGFGGGGFGTRGGGVRMAQQARAPRGLAAGGGPPKPQARSEAAASNTAPSAPEVRQVRVRNFFPETLLFEPALITDEQGRAEMKLQLADSITTWRMTASANGRAGGLGSTAHSIRVFQDFFVDIDLPLALTQNDEVSVPIVVYNYLKTAQRVRLELAAGDWFELRGERVQEIELGPSAVAATSYRLRVVGLGQHSLEVRADGSSMSDAIRREIEVRPDGKEQNQVANGRLEGTVGQDVIIPDTAVAGASKILVRLYPGMFSQVVEGMESMLRLPGG